MERRGRLIEQVAYRGREGREVVYGRSELRLARSQAADQGVEVADELTDLRVVDPDRVKQAGQAGQQPVEDSLAVGQIVGDRRCLGHQARDCGRLTAEDVDDRLRQLVDLRRLEG